MSHASPTPAQYLVLLGVVLLTASMVSTQGSANPPSLQWQTHLDPALAKAKKERKFAIVYAGADWCQPCLKLEAVTFADQAVQKALADFVLVKIDGTDGVPAGLERFAVSQLPTLILLDREGKEIKGGKIVSYLTPEEFLAHLERWTAQAPAKP